MCIYVLTSLNCDSGSYSLWYIKIIALKIATLGGKREDYTMTHICSYYELVAYISKHTKCNSSLCQYTLLVHFYSFTKQNEFYCVYRRNAFIEGKVHEWVKYDSDDYIL